MGYSQIQTVYLNGKVVHTVLPQQTEEVSIRGALPEDKGSVVVTAYNYKMSALNFGNYSGYLVRKVNQMRFTCSYKNRMVECILIENPDRHDRPLYIVKTLPRESRFYRQLITFNNAGKMAEFFFGTFNADPYELFVNSRGESLSVYVQTRQTVQAQTATMFQCIKITGMMTFRNGRQSINVFPCDTMGQHETIKIAAACINGRPNINLWPYRNWKNKAGETLSSCVRMIPFRV